MEWRLNLVSPLPIGAAADVNAVSSKFPTNQSSEWRSNASQTINPGPSDIALRGTYAYRPKRSVDPVLARHPASRKDIISVDLRIESRPHAFQFRRRETRQDSLIAAPSFAPLQNAGDNFFGHKIQNGNQRCPPPRPMQSEGRTQRCKAELQNHLVLYRHFDREPTCLTVATKSQSVFEE